MTRAKRRLAPLDPMTKTAIASGASATPAHNTTVKVLGERQNGVLEELTCLDISPYVTTDMRRKEHHRTFGSKREFWTHVTSPRHRAKPPVKHT